MKRKRVDRLTSKFDSIATLGDVTSIMILYHSTLGRRHQRLASFSESLKYLDDNSSPTERTKAQLQTTTPKMAKLRTKETARGDNFICILPQAVGENDSPIIGVPATSKMHYVTISSVLVSQLSEKKKYRGLRNANNCSRTTRRSRSDDAAAIVARDGMEGGTVNQGYLGEMEGRVKQMVKNKER